MLFVITGLQLLSPSFDHQESADYNFKSYQQIDASPDVVCIGSSLMECAFMPNVLYDEYGIRAYNLAAPSYRLDSSFLVLDMVQKSNRPKVVLIETDFIDELTRQDTLNNEILSTRFLQINKLSYLYAHFGLKTMEYIKYIFPVLQFHEDLINGEMGDSTEEKILRMYREVYTKGYYQLQGVEQTSIGLSNVAQSDLDKSVIQYLRNKVDALKNQGIEVVFITIPSSEDFPYSNTIRVNFSDCGYLNLYNHIAEMQLDNRTDFANANHMNISGAYKITKCIGKYLNENYILCEKSKQNDIWKITDAYCKKYGEEFQYEEWKKMMNEEGYVLE